MRQIAFFASFLALAVLVSIEAHATKPAIATGSFEVLDSQIMNFRVTDDGNFVVTTNALMEFSGTFDGVFEAENTAIVEPSTGHVVLTSLGTFTGEVDGVEGTLILRRNANGDLARLEGRFTILSGTGDLSNLTGRAIFDFDAGTQMGAYSGTIHFDP